MSITHNRRGGTTPRGLLTELLVMVVVSAILLSAHVGAVLASLVYLSAGGSFDTATLVTPGTYSNSPSSYASGFYKLLVSRGTTIAVLLQPSPSGDFDLHLYDGYRAGVANSTTPERGAPERAQLVAEVTGYYYVEARYVSGQGDYTLTVDASTLRVVDVDWGTAASTVDAAPGDQGVPLTVKVRNENGFTVTDVYATLYLDEAFSNASGGAAAIAQYSQPVPPSQSFDLIFTLSLNSSGALGVHPLTMAVSYYLTSTSTSTSTTTTTTTISKTETSTTQTSTSSTSTSLSASLPFNLTVPVQVLGRAVFQFAFSQLFLQPGNSTTLALAVRNVGTAPAGSGELTLTAPLPLALTGTGNRWGLGGVLQGEEVTVSVSLYAPTSAQGNTFQLTVAFAYQSPTGLMRTEIQTLAVTVSTASDVQFIVLVDGQSLKAGDVSNVTFTVVNNGTAAASSVDVALTPSQPLSLGGKDNRWFTPSLAPQQAFTFQAAVYAPYASQGQTYSATVSISYKTPEGVGKTDVRGGIGFNVRSAAEAGPVLSVLVDKSDLLAGQVNNVSLMVSNDGVSPAHSLFVTLSTPPGLTIVGRSNRWFVAQVEPGERAVLPLQLFASSENLGSGAPSTVTLKYRDSRSNDITETSNLGFTTRGYIDLYIMNIVTSPSPAVSGMSLIVSGSVLNEGSVTAKAVNVSLGQSSQGAFSATAGSSNLVGDAPVGLQTPFSINVLLAGTTSNGTYSLPLELTFKDDRSELRRLTTAVPVMVVTTAPSQPEQRPTVQGLGLPGLILLAAAFFIVGFVVATLFQRRRRPSSTG